jgi:hypothetical protein
MTKQDNGTINIYDCGYLFMFPVALLVVWRPSGSCSGKHCLTPPVGNLVTKGCTSQTSPERSSVLGMVVEGLVSLENRSRDCPARNGCSLAAEPLSAVLAATVPA